MNTTKVAPARGHETSFLGVVQDGVERAAFVGKAPKGELAGRYEVQLSSRRDAGNKRYCRDGSASRWNETSRVWRRASKTNRSSASHWERIAVTRRKSRRVVKACSRQGQGAVEGNLIYWQNAVCGRLLISTSPSVGGIKLLARRCGGYAEC